MNSKCRQSNCLWLMSAPMLKSALLLNVTSGLWWNSTMHSSFCFVLCLLWSIVVSPGSQFPTSAWWGWNYAGLLWEGVHCHVERQAEPSNSRKSYWCLVGPWGDSGPPALECYYLEAAARGWRWGLRKEAKEY